MNNCGGHQNYLNLHNIDPARVEAAHRFDSVRPGQRREGMAKSFNEQALRYLEYAHLHAEKHSGCTKVIVGSVIVTPGGETVFGANVTVPNWCRTKGCLRMELFGENSKAHRGAAECRAVHSEVDAIATAARNGIAVDGSIIYITRYPCEACARSVVRAGIVRVVYGRQQEITEQTRTIFEWGGVEVLWLKEFEAEDVFI